MEQYGLKEEIIRAIVRECRQTYTALFAALKQEAENHWMEG